MAYAPYAPSESAIEYLLNFTLDVWPLEAEAL